MISQTVEYALRAAVSLAHWHGQPRTAGHLAADTKVSTTYVSKVMHHLVRKGIVTSQRGPGGGFALARDPAEITMYDVVDAVDPFPRIRRCPLEIGSHGVNLCPLHRRLDDAMGTVEEAFRRTPLSQLLVGESGIKPLCETPLEGE